MGKKVLYLKAVKTTFYVFKTWSALQSF